VGSIYAGHYAHADNPPRLSRFCNDPPGSSCRYYAKPYPGSGGVPNKEALEKVYDYFKRYPCSQPDGICFASKGRQVCTDSATNPSRRWRDRPSLGQY
jgi:hypothetical protein